MTVRRPELPVLAPATSTPTLPAINLDPGDDRASEPIDRGDGDFDGDDLTACTGDEVIVLGASSTAGRLTVDGASTRDPGSPVSLLSDDGWALGRTTVDAAGLFRATVREPRASQRIDRVLARLDDGEQSPEAAVVRDNVLRAVRHSGNLLAVEGTLAPRARGPRVRIDVVIPGATPCGPARKVRASNVHVDRRTGRYRATAKLTPGATTFSAAESLPVVAAQVTVWGPGLPRRVTTSQPIVDAPSGIPVR